MMTADRRSRVTAAEVVTRIQSEIEVPAANERSTPFAERMAHVQALQRHYRNEPIGGRLIGVKRIFAWFSASTFDRQAKVVEALLDLVDDLGAEIERQRFEIDRLQAESRGSDPE